MSEVRSFMGLASYYRRFVKGFAEIARPLHQLTEKNRRFEWTSECQKAFEELKARLTSPPILAYPLPEGDFILDTDASDSAIGAVLSQVQDGDERVVAYASKSLGKAERNYCVTRKELLAIVVYLKHFRQYLYGRRVTIRTDHGSLRWLTTFKEPMGQLARWLEIISEYDVHIVHRAGRIHGNADGLSRRPCTQCGREEDEASGDEVQACILLTDSTVENERMKKLQGDDEDISPVLAAKTTGERPTNEQASPWSNKAKRLLEHWDVLEVHEGLLYRRWESADAKVMRRQLILPRSIIPEVVKELHAGSTSGHFGFAKCLGRTRLKYYWVGMAADFRSALRECNDCARRKTSGRTRRAPLQQRISGSPMERIALDILGPLPESRKGNKYILVVGDYFTKWMEAYAVPDERAETVAEKLVVEFLCRFGVPRQIHSDQGRNFESDVFKEVCRLMGVDKTRTTSYNPKSDGLIERFNRTLLDIVATMIDPNARQRDWDVHLPFCTAAYRNAPQESTGETPNMLMLGREATLPTDLAMPPPPEDEDVKTDYAAKLRDVMRGVHEKARRNLKEAGSLQKKNYDQKSTTVKYEEGQFVWLRKRTREKGLTPKLQPRWLGPYLIVTRMSDVTFRVQLSPRSHPMVVHADRMKKYEGPSRETWRFKRKESPRIESEGGENSAESEEACEASGTVSGDESGARGD